MPSSPHARGSSGSRASTGRPATVVPARAGIFRSRAFRSRPRRRRPRTRGDLPIFRSFETHCLVVPARAGIFPLRSCTVIQTRGRPRTRGDLPPRGQSWSGGARSSPHARGSSPRRTPQAATRRVVPARAGIFRASVGSSSAEAGRPRTRGDLPSGEESRAQSHSSSPHARGSSPQMRWESLPSRVVPARAGIFLEMDADHTARIGRPRTRGDLPIQEGADRDRRASSPHARGSSGEQGSRVSRSRRGPPRRGCCPGWPRSMGTGRARPPESPGRSPARCRGSVPRSAYSAPGCRCRS